MLYNWVIFCVTLRAGFSRSSSSPSTAIAFNASAAISRTATLTEYHPTVDEENETASTNDHINASFTTRAVSSHSSIGSTLSAPITSAELTKSTFTSTSPSVNTHVSLTTVDTEVTSYPSTVTSSLSINTGSSRRDTAAATSTVIDQTTASYRYPSTTQIHSTEVWRTKDSVASSQEGKTSTARFAVTTSDVREFTTVTQKHHLRTSTNGVTAEQTTVVEQSTERLVWPPSTRDSRATLFNHTTLTDRILSR